MTKQLLFSAKNNTLYCQHTWCVSTLRQLQQTITSLNLPNNIELTLDAENLQELDTAGAWLLHQLIQKLKQTHQLSHIKIQPLHQDLLELVQQADVSEQIPEQPTPSSWLTRVGKQAVIASQELFAFFTLVGELTWDALSWLTHPSKILWRSIFNTIQTTGYQALIIIGLLSFLIGIVLTYQMGIQLRDYGGNIFIVDLLGLAILREFAPLITAILVAGRSGSAFTAQIGTMQINQEVDALKTMGISASQQLVLPRLIGLSIALPLLTVWSCITGILGGMIMSQRMLGIGYYDFLSRFQDVVATKNYVIGISKTPAFALIIACIGCFQGLQVSGSATSVGTRTTQSVVHAIFLIICADAFFSILLSWYNL